VGALHEGGAGQLLHLRLGQRRFSPIETSQIAMNWRAFCLELIPQTDSTIEQTLMSF
jgi:hypothetical protein